MQLYIRQFALLAIALLALVWSAAAQEDFSRWPVQPDRFPSTGGNGVVIGEYRPVVIGDRCVTAFTATTADGTVYRNLVLFDASATQGGVLCSNGRWTAQDGSASGTTPYRVFLKDGVIRGAP